MRNSFITLFLIFVCISAIGQTDIEITTPKKELITAKKIVDGLRNPWGMAFLPDGSILITEKSGELILFKEGKKQQIANLPEVVVIGQGGLLDIAVHPNYEKEPWIYFTLGSPAGIGEGGNTALYRAQLSQGGLEKVELLYKASPNTDSFAHWGSRIEFDNEGFIYFSIGDRFNRDENPQNIKRDGGKVYRLNADGSIPKDNPFVAVAGAKQAVFSYGHRNPQGMAKHPRTGKIWVHEHGPKGGDEINLIEKGKNYGWPVITYGKNYNGTTITTQRTRAGMEQPIYYWIPSIAPCGMAFVNSQRYPFWNNSMLVGSLKFGYLERLEMKDDKVIIREKLLEGIGRLRNVEQAPNGFIYIAVEGDGIYQLVPNN